MLTDHPKLKGTMPKAWHEEVWRANPSGDLDAASHEVVPKAKLVVDETDTVLGTVSNRHTIVQNRELVSALEVAADRCNIDVEPLVGRYRRGRATYEFHVPTLDMRPFGDPSKTTPRITLVNDHSGTGGLKVLSGWYRLVCTNGLTIGTVLHQNTVRHTGEIDVLGFVQAAVEKIQDEFEVQGLLARNLWAERHHFVGAEKPREEAVKRVSDPDKYTPTLVDQIIADTSARYDSYLRTAMHENRREIGDNLWALAQAVSQTSTHRMPGANADAWATRQLNRIREHVGL